MYRDVGPSLPYAMNTTLDTGLSQNAKERRFVCEWEHCGKSFYRRTDVTRHMKIHYDHRPFACDWIDCVKRFRQRSALRIHRRTHTGEKPNACPFAGCSKTFNDSSSLARHRRVHLAKVVGVDSMAHGVSIHTQSVDEGPERDRDQESDHEREQEATTSLSPQDSDQSRGCHSNPMLPSISLMLLPHNGVGSHAEYAHPSHEHAQKMTMLPKMQLQSPTLSPHSQYDRVPSRITRAHSTPYSNNNGGRISPESVPRSLSKRNLSAISFVEHSERYCKSGAFSEMDAASYSISNPINTSRPTSRAAYTTYTAYTSPNQSQSLDFHNIPSHMVHHRHSNTYASHHASSSAYSGEDSSFTVSAITSPSTLDQPISSQPPAFQRHSFESLRPLVSLPPPSMTQKLFRHPRSPLYTPRMTQCVRSNSPQPPDNTSDICRLPNMRTTLSSPSHLDWFHSKYDRSPRAREVLLTSSAPNEGLSQSRSHSADVALYLSAVAESDTVVLSSSNKPLCVPLRGICHLSIQNMLSTPVDHVLSP
ncbi:hypothetical protein BASA50_010482 [Batrachochytrium salamandrivorans]|uniref:C2H2-type domain-containing protein n=1 Tax=Batrachochytrium salamandrivorans TaxID=1357716 RepID=A0ABQ8EYD3_9FUNG|nr:hypothetical protein BASA60_007497 [Batrachochytrium salamandrivorans]KAH6584776.1 hypothetical protein BASA61_007268 [Batrachochytrium salamandrivorans]KAH6588776.1 hypothetical protein BASA50_010482 [Batrachochytrium salamandrivorans]